MCDTDDMTNDETYERILEGARNDSEVLGFALTRGRGKGFVTEHSDYCCSGRLDENPRIVNGLVIVV